MGTRNDDIPETCDVEAIRSVHLAADTFDGSAHDAAWIVVHKHRDALLAEVDRLRSALRFYAAPKTIAISAPVLRCTKNDRRR